MDEIQRLNLELAERCQQIIKIEGRLATAQQKLEEADEQLVKQKYLLTHLLILIRDNEIELPEQMKEDVLEAVKLGNHI